MSERVSKVARTDSVHTLETAATSHRWCTSAQCSVPVYTLELGAHDIAIWLGPYLRFHRDRQCLSISSQIQLATTAPISAHLAIHACPLPLLAFQSNFHWPTFFTWMYSCNKTYHSPTTLSSLKERETLLMVVQEIQKRMRWLTCLLVIMNHSSAQALTGGCFFFLCYLAMLI